MSVELSWTVDTSGSGHFEGSCECARLCAWRSMLLGVFMLFTSDLVPDVEQVFCHAGSFAGGAGSFVESCAGLRLW